MEKTAHSACLVYYGGLCPLCRRRGGLGGAAHQKIETFNHT